MADSPTTTAVPTPRDVAHTPAPAPYSRRVWEQAIRHSILHPYSRLMAMMLAHYADTAGHIPSSDVLVAARLAKACGVPVQDAHISLSVLYRERYIDRGPSIGHMPRSVTLTLPAAPAPVRTVPPHTGEAS